MSAKVIAVANNKGGVGKTALVTNVGASLARRGYKTLLVDLDGQANLTDAFLQEEQVERSIAEALREGQPLPIQNLKENLYIVPGSPETSYLEEERVALFSDALQPLKALYDYILIDTPPSIGTPTLSALSSATEVVIPLTAELSSLKGLNALIEIVDNMQKGANKKLRLLGAVLCFYDERKRLSKLVIETIEETFEGVLFHSTIRRNIAVAEAGLEYSDVYAFNKKSRGAADYEALTEELLSKLNNSAKETPSAK